MGVRCLLMGLVLKIIFANGKISDTKTSLHVVPPFYEHQIVQFTCLNASHAPGQRTSWVLITGNSERQININTTDNGEELNLVVQRTMHGAKLVCRSYKPTSYNQVKLSHPFKLRVKNSHATFHNEGVVSKVAAQIGNTTYYKEGSLSRRAGDEVDVTCGVANPSHPSVYIYVLLRNEDEDIETEITGALVTDQRLKQVSGRYTVRAEHKNWRIYCLARWFPANDSGYEQPSALRSAPVTLLVDAETPDCVKDSIFLWIAVGLGVLGWLVAASLLALLLHRRKRLNSTEVEQHENRSSVGRWARWCCGSGTGGRGCCGTSDVSNTGAGATVLPMHAVRSLTAANVKLGPSLLTAPPGPPPIEEPAYINVEELNVLLNKRFF